MRLLALLVLSLAFSSPGFGASVSITGRIIQVDTDLGGVFTGTAVDDEFTAHFDYPDTGGASTINEPDESNYELTGMHFLSRGAASVVGTAVNVNIQNDQPSDAELAQLFNDLVMPSPPAMGGDPVDSWTIAGLETGAYEEDTTPGDGDDEETLFDGVLFEFTLLSLDTTLYDNLAYRPNPPSPADAPLRVFVVREADAAGNSLFAAFGVIDEVMVIPDAVFANGFEP